MSSKFIYGYSTQKKYHFKTPVDIRKISQLLVYNGIDVIQVKDRYLLVKYNEKQFRILINSKKNRLWLQKQINLLKCLMYFFAIFIIPIAKISIEHLLNDTWNRIVSLFAAALVIGWIIYFYGFRSDKATKGFVKKFDGIVFNQLL